MDPITILAAAKASYEALRAGIAVGKELQHMAQDLSSLFGSVAHITRIAAEPARGSLLAGKSAEQMAMEAFAAKAEADQLMADLKNHFIGEYGLAAWDQVVAATTQIKKQQIAEQLEAGKAQDELVANVMGIGALVLMVITLAGIGLLLLVKLTH